MHLNLWDLKTIGFGGGREDVWEPQEDIYWGIGKKNTSEQIKYQVKSKIENPLAAVQMGLFM